MGWDLCAGLFYEHRFAMLITRYSAVNIASVKINTSLIMMKECAMCADLKSRERIYKMPPNRYNVSGFVEELPQLPKNRYGHACAALPTTGVRPAQPTF